MHDWKQYVAERLGSLRIRPEREAEVIRELAGQLEETYRSALAAGAEETEALERAAKQFPDWGALGREIEAAERFYSEPLTPGREGGWWTGLLNDLKYAARVLLKNPGFAAASILTVAFGIGASTAIFATVDAIEFRRVPYRDADRLVVVETRKVKQAEIEPWSSADDFLDLRERAKTLSGVAAVSPIWNLVMTGTGRADRLECLFVSAEFFQLLGVSPVLGRTFSPEEDQRAKPAPVVVLGHSFWVREFGADTGVIGKRVQLDSNVYTVVGVLPRRFHYAGEPLAGTGTEIDIWLPLAANQLASSPRHLRYLKLIGRLAPGATLEQARSEVSSIASALAEEHPESNRGYATGVRLLRDQVAGPLRPAVVLLLAALAIVLLMACASVANMLLARMAARQKEMSVRMALGASGWRLLRQVLTESLLVAAAGGATGLLLGRWGLDLLLSRSPAAFVRRSEVGFDYRVLAFAVAAIAASAMLAGLPPAWRILRSGIAAALSESGRGGTDRRGRTQPALVAAQLSLATVLLVCAGMLMHSLLRLREVNPGFDAGRAVTFSTQVPASATAPAQRTAVYREIRDQLLTNPAVEEVGAVSRLPMLGSNIGSWLTIEGRSFSTGEQPEVEYRVATPSYFPAMRIPLRRGRLIEERDESHQDPVLVINETMARMYWRDGDPVGSRIKLGSGPQPWITIVGVVGDVRHFGLDEQPRPEIYRPYAYNPLFAPILVVRTKADPATMIKPLGDAIHAVNPELPVYNAYAMQQLVDRSTAQRSFLLTVLAAFAGAALLLAAIGIYGVAAQAVSQRTREIGLRMAVGATPGSILRMVLADGARVAAIGLAAGYAGAAALGRMLGKLMFGVGPVDGPVLAGALVVVFVVAIAACYIPARRATRIDPIVALRWE
ncbi:MAG: ABC transporter permease [Acidobacteriota bacterium]|nr:ABC transporter permease [Acidobacteriota bacterium]